MATHNIIVDLPEINENIPIELNDEQAPITVKAILDKLPITVQINRWGEELYTEPLPFKVGLENAKALVSYMDAAYWPEGSALCLFFGPTPISEGSEIKPYSPVNLIGRITSKKNIARKVDDNTRIIIRK